MSYTIPDIATVSVLPRADDYLEQGGVAAGSARMLLQNLPQKVATFAALKALVIANAANLLNVFCQGGAASGDGLGGWFRYDSASAVADDGANYLQPNAGAGRWIRQLDKTLPVCVSTIAALKALPVALIPNGSAIQVLGYYAAGDGGGGDFFYNSGSAVADNGGTVIQPTAGAGRWIRSFIGSLSIRWFGAKGDGATDDTTKIQACVDAAIAIPNSTVFIPVSNAAQYFKITAPITFSAPLNIEGDSILNSCIIGVGFVAGQYLFDFNLGAGTNYHWRMANFQLRSLDGVPRGMRLKNTSYVTMENVWFNKCKHGIVFQGTGTFSNYFRNVIFYSTVSNGVWFDTFTGGGQYTFSGCTFDGDTGFHLDTTSALSGGLTLLSCNFEACVTNCLYFGGTVNGVSITGCRTESNAGAADFQINPSAGNFVDGLNISGCFFAAASAVTRAILIGGAGGRVRGLSICGNYAYTSSSVDYFVFLNGDGESAIIAGNRFDCAATVPTNVQRAGVIIFGNENATGKCAEYWGLAKWGVTEANWVPTDQSGAGLAFTAAAGFATTFGRMTFWQAIVVYPVTANGATAVIGGLPSNPTLGGASQGRAGGRVDSTDAALPLGLYQGTPNTNKLQVVNQQTQANITNAQLSGKTLYISGFYTV